MAWYWQTSAHLPQCVHFDSSTRGIRNPNVLALLEGRLKEQVGVGRFDVTIQKKRRRGQLRRQAERQAGGNRRLAGAALAAGNGDFHPLPSRVGSLSGWRAEGVRAALP